MVSSEVKPELENPLKTRQFFEFLANKFKDQNSSHFYMARPEDFDDFTENYEIKEILKDIRNRLDLNDERVLVYAQPIYSVETGSFRVAEALMRLTLGERLITPEKFIGCARRFPCFRSTTILMPFPSTVPPRNCPRKI